MFISGWHDNMKVHLVTVHHRWRHRSGCPLEHYFRPFSMYFGVLVGVLSSATTNTTIAILPQGREENGKRSVETALATSSYLLPGQLCRAGRRCGSCEYFLSLLLCPSSWPLAWRRRVRPCRRTKALLIGWLPVSPFPFINSFYTHCTCSQCNLS